MLDTIARLVAASFGRSGVDERTVLGAAEGSRSAATLRIFLAWHTTPDIRDLTRARYHPVPGMWLLRHLPDGLYAPTPVYSFGHRPEVPQLFYSVAPGSGRPAVFAYGAEADLEEKILLELGAAAAIETTTYTREAGLLVEATRGMSSYLAGSSQSLRKTIGLGCRIANCNAPQLVGRGHCGVGRVWEGLVAEDPGGRPCVALVPGLAEQIESLAATVK